MAPSEPTDSGPPRPFHEWYGNLIRIERRKSLVFTDSVTLFTFMIPNVLKKQYLEFDGLFRKYLAVALDAAAFPPARTRWLGQMEFATTRDRRILSSMNDLVFQLTTYVHYDGGLDQLDVRSVIRRVNQTPMSLIDNSPTRAVREYFALGAI